MPDRTEHLISNRLHLEKIDTGFMLVYVLSERKYSQCKITMTGSEIEEMKRVVEADFNLLQIERLRDDDIPF